MPKLLTESEVASLTQLSMRTLQAWRTSGRGPKFHKLGGSVRYDEAEIAAWITAATCSSTSRASEAASAGHMPDEKGLSSALPPKAEPLHHPAHGLDARRRVRDAVRNKAPKS